MLSYKRVEEEIEFVGKKKNSVKNDEGRRGNTLYI